MPMSGRCFGTNMGVTETTAPIEPSSKSARRKRMELHQFNFVPNESTVSSTTQLPLKKRQKIETLLLVQPNKENEINPDTKSFDPIETPSSSKFEIGLIKEFPKFGLTSVCGRRRDMEDAVAIHPFFSSSRNTNSQTESHFFGVYDGHGCSHVATRCKDKMHEIVRGEMESGESSWEEMMSRSFAKMDKEVTEWTSDGTRCLSGYTCRCELQTPQCDAVGSTAIVAVVTPEKIVVSNTGDSRAVLCRNGVAIPLSVDHKPDRADELNRIEEAGGRVIFWDGPRVLGVLAMSRAIGDNYLKPYVIPDPEVTVTDRADEDECLILASDGLWDVVSNETACGVARMCLQSQNPPSPVRSPGSNGTVIASGESSDQACSDASILLTKLALARHSTDNVSVVVVDLRNGR